VRPGGVGPEYISVKRDTRKEEHEERAEIRALLRKAFADDAPEAEALIESVPVRAPPTAKRLEVDWPSFEQEFAALEALLVAYGAHLKAKADAEDDDETFILLAA
jgi:hypothetical protein